MKQSYILPISSFVSEFKFIMQIQTWMKLFRTMLAHVEFILSIAKNRYLASLYKTAKSATSAMNHLLRLVKWHTVADKILLHPTTNIIHNRTEGVTYEYTGIIKSITYELLMFGRGVTFLFTCFRTWRQNQFLI